MAERTAQGSAQETVRRITSYSRNYSTLSESLLKKLGVDKIAGKDIGHSQDSIGKKNDFFKDF